MQEIVFDLDSMMVGIAPAVCWSTQLDLVQLAATRTFCGNVPMDRLVRIFFEVCPKKVVGRLLSVGFVPKDSRATGFCAVRRGSK